ncbi:NADP-dependent oxidoreductase [Rhizobium calliandrae]|uniref:NADP-dependent oxidoreductase n=1 Tax=Rhizobium calliandrae TaxID=1312182 RepID=A0ABT7KB37_9HYPH|nr:NADP-dependent oxidoreductase [Rhizobium calliandrae]MDL2405839.1 NADP-dependent oxidoreductase [Rhizobium calliandrae]
MKAILYREHGPANVMHYVDLPDPSVGRGQILVRLAAASVAPFDWKLRAGHLRDHFTLPMPSIPGRDGAGEVIAVGDDVTEFAIGDRASVVAGVFSQGCYAEKIACDARNAVRIPDNLNFVEAAALSNPGRSAWICLRTAEVKSGDKVLVHAGAGAVGGLLVQLCHHIGANVTATCRAANLDYVLGLGANHVVAYDQEDFTALRDRDVVFDLVGGDVHDRSYQVLKRGGRLIWLVADPIIDRSAEFGVTVTRAMITDDKEVLQSMMDLAEAGMLKPQVARTMQLQDAAEAHRLMEAGAISRGRLVLTMG